MANTIDNYTIRVGVEGMQALEQSGASFQRVGENVDKLQKNINAFRATNIANQIQDIAVQAEMGTNWTRILAQQLPQLGTAFGAVGSVAGAVAAIFFATLGPALKVAGIDVRNLTELLTDSEKAIKAFHDAQRQATLSSNELSATYGELAANAKKFFDVQREGTQQKTTFELAKTITEIRDKYGFLTQSVIDAQRAQEEFATSYMGAEAAIGAGAGSLAIQLRAKWLGLSVEQATELGKRMADLDAKAPEKNLEIITGISKYLQETTKDADTFLRLSEKVIEPLYKTNQLILDQKKNLEASATMANQLAIALLNIQSKYQPDINAARRNFDQISAIRLEGTMKVEEYARQLADKRGLTERQREQELAAFKSKTQLDVNDKIKDYVKSQQESFYADQLANESKDRQLRLQNKINDLQVKQIDNLDYDLLLEQDRLKIINDQVDANLKYEEQFRKGQINREQANMLEQQAAELRNQAEKNSIQNIQKLQLENQRLIDILKFDRSYDLEYLKQKYYLEQQSLGQSTIMNQFDQDSLELSKKRNDAILSITRDTKKSADEKAAAIAIENKAYNDQIDLLTKQYEYRIKINESFGAGATQRIKEISESLSNFKVAGQAVDAVWNGMSTAIDTFVTTGKFKFADFARSIIFDIEKILLKAAAINFLKAGASVMGFSIPGLAAGGPVRGGYPYLVGEQGPELFVPSGAGKIVPNGSLGGGGTTIINNISAVDAKSVAQLFAEHRMTLLGTVESARRELPMRTR